MTTQYLTFIKAVEKQIEMQSSTGVIKGVSLISIINFFIDKQKTGAFDNATLRDFKRDVGEILDKHNFVDSRGYLDAAEILAYSDEKVSSDADMMMLAKDIEQKKFQEQVNDIEYDYVVFMGKTQDPVKQEEKEPISYFSNETDEIKSDEQAPSIFKM